MNILDVTSPTIFDDTITSEDFHVYYPYASSSFKKNDEIRIPVQNQDAYTLPSHSFLRIEGTYKKTAAGANFVAADNASFGRNGVAHLFSEIRYELNGTVIDQTRNPGMVGTLKTLCSHPNSQANLLHANGYDCSHIFRKIHGSWSVEIPLSSLLGFAEDYKKILINARQELILMRANTNINAVITDIDDTELTVTKVCWCLPHISVSDAARAELLKILDRDPWLDIGFMKWEIHEYPDVNQTTTHTWSVKSSAKLETPRYIIFALQTNKRNVKDAGASNTDNCHLSRFRVLLNGVQFPYDWTTSDFDNKHWEQLYNMYARFQESYYGRKSEPMLSYEEFGNKPIVVVDCSHQNELVKGGTVDVQLEWETRQAIPANTIAYCLILHDRVVRYQPLSSTVQVL